MYNKISNLYTEDEKIEYESLKIMKIKISSNKRTILHGFFYNTNFVNETLIDEYRFKYRYNKFIEKIKPKLFKNIFDVENKDKHKEDFIKNNKKSILPVDLLLVIYNYYEENKYIYLIRYNETNNFLIFNKKPLLKDFFLSNNIQVLIRLNCDKIIDKFQKNPKSIFNGKILYHNELNIYNKVFSNYKFFNDFSPLISLKIFYFKKNHKNIKYKFFNITNYNILYKMKSFLDKNFITKYEFYFINSMNYYKDYLDREIIDSNRINKSLFLTEIDEFLFPYLHKISNYKNNKSNKISISS